MERSVLVRSLHMHMSRSHAQRSLKITICMSRIQRPGAHLAQEINDQGIANYRFSGESNSPTEGVTLESPLVCNGSTAKGRTLNSLVLRAGNTKSTLARRRASFPALSTSAVKVNRVVCAPGFFQTDNDLERSEFYEMPKTSGQSTARRPRRHQGSKPNV